MIKRKTSSEDKYLQTVEAIEIRAQRLSAVILQEHKLR